MKDTRFLEILNGASANFPGIWDVAAARRGDASSLAAWAGFLAACVSAGATITDDRWRSLEVQRGPRGYRFSLPKQGSSTVVADDFGVGLALLMNLLERQTPPE